MSPYQEAFRWIDHNPGTGSGSSLAKLLLSLWNDDYGFSIREIISGLDNERRTVMLRVIQHYMVSGETEELRDIGLELYERYPRLAELAREMSNARIDVQDRWRREDELRAAEEE